jgi:hypothetical protein
MLASRHSLSAHTPLICWSCWQCSMCSRALGILDRPFELHKDNVSLQWLQQQWHLSHSDHQALWLNLLAEFPLCQAGSCISRAGPTPPTSSRGSAPPTASAWRSTPATLAGLRPRALHQPRLCPGHCVRQINVNPPIPHYSSTLTLWSPSRAPDGPAFKTAAATLATAARNFVSCVCRNVGLERVNSRA